MHHWPRTLRGHVGMATYQPFLARKRNTFKHIEQESGTCKHLLGLTASYGKETFHGVTHWGLP